jgi:hypothetical protein
MPSTRPSPGKRTFTVAEANATLPYVRAIVGDIVQLAQDLRDRHERLARLRPGPRGSLSEAHREELLQARAEIERGQERMQEFETELRQIGVELKDCFSGLVDFPSLRNGRLVYLCWRLGEPQVAHWHELDAGFAGRQRLTDGPQPPLLGAGAAEPGRDSPPDRGRRS